MFPLQDSGSVYLTSVRSLVQFVLSLDRARSARRLTPGNFCSASGGKGIQQVILLLSIWVADFTMLRPCLGISVISRCPMISGRILGFRGYCPTVLSVGVTVTLGRLCDTTSRMTQINLNWPVLLNFCTQAFNDPCHY